MGSLRTVAEQIEFMRRWDLDVKDVEAIIAKREWKQVSIGLVDD